MAQCFPRETKKVKSLWGEGTRIMKKNVFIRDSD